MTESVERRPTAFGRSLRAEYKTRGLNREEFAEECGVSVSALKQWEYGWRGISHKRAMALARKLGRPPWHFEQALLQDRLAAICCAREVTAVVVGFALYVERALPGAEWAEARAKLLEGM